MSEFIRHRIDDFVIEACDAGERFATADCQVQAQFLIGWMEAQRDFCWPMQCRYMLDFLPEDCRSELSVMLKTLCEHLDETGTTP